MNTPYIMTEQGDDNHLDSVTRERMQDATLELQWMKLLKLGWFFIGMIVGSVLHDGVFHAIEQAVK